MSSKIQIFQPTPPKYQHTVKILNFYSLFQFKVYSIEEKITLESQIIPCVLREVKERNILSMFLCDMDVVQWTLIIDFMKEVM